jgi:uncharacterized membrane protein/Flp pilus assembly protein TadD
MTRRALRFLRPEWVFFVLALCFGIALLVLTVPFEAPDEPTHFFRAFQVSEGRLISLKQGGETGDYLPQSLPSLVDRFQAIRVQPKTTAREILDTAAIHADSDNRLFVKFSNTAAYPPLPYLPQAVGILIARQLSSSVLVWCYAGRLLNLLAATALTFFAVRRSPIAKWAFVVLALMPMALFQAASLSSDALTNALAFLLIAQVLACALQEDGRVSTGSLLFLSLLGAAIGLAKQAYFGLPLCYLMIPSAKLGTRRRYWISFVVVMSSTLLTAAIWSLIVHHIYSPAQPGIDPGAQLRSMCSQPLVFLMGLLRTVTLFVPSHLWQYVGILGWLDAPLPIWMVVAELLLLIVVIIGDFDGCKRLTIRQSSLALAVAAIVGLTVLVVLHLTWDSVGDTSRLSVQGRYFIPMGPLVAVGLLWLGSSATGFQPKLRSSMPAVVAICAPCFLAVTVATVHHRYFADDPDAFAWRQMLDGNRLASHDCFDEAILHYQRALAAKPDYVDAHLQLGSVLAARGRLNEAIIHYETALKVKPGSAEDHDNLGAALGALGQSDQAIAHFQKALEIDPKCVEAHFNLGIALNQQGRLAEAVAHWREAVRLQPTQVTMLNELAWTLATCREESLRDAPEAVTLAQRALELSGGQEPAILDTLAAAYAEAGRFDEAVTTVERALNLASAQNKTALAHRLHDRIKLYQAGLAFHER